MNHRLDPDRLSKLRAALEHPAALLWGCALWIGAAVVLVGIAYVASGVDGHADLLLEDLVEHGTVAAVLAAVGAMAASAIEALTDGRPRR